MPAVDQEPGQDVSPAKKTGSGTTATANSTIFLGLGPRTSIARASWEAGVAVALAALILWQPRHTLGSGGLPEERIEGGINGSRAKITYLPGLGYKFPGSLKSCLSFRDRPFETPDRGVKSLQQVSKIGVSPELVRKLMSSEPGWLKRRLGPATLWIHAGGPLSLSVHQKNRNLRMWGNAITAGFNEWELSHENLNGQRPDLSQICSSIKS